MYSRKTGIMYNPSETQKKIESFNSDLREQYMKRGAVVEGRSREAVSTSGDESSSLIGLLRNDDIIILALIAVLLFEEKRDYFIIGVLAMLLFLK